MSHLSPCVFLIWAVLSACLTGFYFYHLWMYDRLRCMNPFVGRMGAFQRIMTYSYLVALPVLLVFTVGFTIIKYQEGYIVVPATGQIIAKPYELWTLPHQNAYAVLTSFWAISWCLEAISHNEELCFWLYLLHAGPSPVPWFKSIYFRVWIIASVGASLIILTAVGVTHDDPLKMEAWTQFTGSLTGLLNTLGFLPVLYVFPNFIQAVKNEGGDMAAITRLAKFYDLNVIRVVFRFLFVVPILILSSDGIKPHNHPINEALISTDFLTVLSGIACIVQSAITLMIFFPRNVETETKRWLKSRSRSQNRSRTPGFFSRSGGGPSEGDSQAPYRDERRGRPEEMNAMAYSNASASIGGAPPRQNKYLLTDSPVDKTNDLPILPSGDAPPYTAYPPVQLQYEPEPTKLLAGNHLGLGLSTSPAYTPTVQPTTYPPVSFNNKRGGHGKRDSVGGAPESAKSRTSMELSEANMKMYQQNVSKINPLALYFRSPLDFDDNPSAGGHVFERI